MILKDSARRHRNSRCRLRRDALSCGESTAVHTADKSTEVSDCFSERSQPSDPSHREKQSLTPVMEKQSLTSVDLSVSHIVATAQLACHLHNRTVLRNKSPPVDYDASIRNGRNSVTVLQSVIIVHNVGWSRVPYSVL